MNRTDVIKRFLNKERATSGARDLMTGGRVASISSDGRTLWSYWTPLACWNGERVLMTGKKYSATTSRQQSALKLEAERAGVELIELKSELDGDHLRGTWHK